VKDGALGITPEKAAKQRPFMAYSNLNIAGPATATLELQSTTGGAAGFAWRTQGQRDFPPGQSVSIRIAASDQWQEIRAELPAQGPIIHLRVLLPEGESSIRHIGLVGAKGGAARSWHFSQRPSGP
jgi:hypothetical protein